MAVQTLTGACHCGKVRIEADLDLAAGPVRYFDGRDNNWMQTPKFTGYL